MDARGRHTTARCSRFNYLAQEVEDHSRKRVHMSVIGDWSLWPEGHRTLCNVVTGNPTRFDREQKSSNSNAGIETRGEKVVI